MKTKLSTIAFFACATGATTLLADGEMYNGNKFPWGVDFSRQELANSSWVNATLEGAIFSGTTLTNADFTGANLEFAWFDNDYEVIGGIAYSYKITLTNATFTSANLSNAYFWGADLTGCSFENATITMAQFSQSTLSFEQLSSTKTYKEDKDLSGMDLSYLDMSSADFSGITLSQTNFGCTVLQGANFENAVIGEGTDFSCAQITTEQLRKTKTYKEEKNFSGVEFGFSDLSNIDFSKFTLEKSSFWGTTLSGVDFSDANLSDASFHRYYAATPNGVVIRKVDLTDANFTCANLTSARIYGADLTRADFRGAISADLGEIKTSASTNDNWGKNVVLPGGTIKNFSLSNGGAWTIRSSEASRVSAKLMGENTITEGTLIVSQGALNVPTLEIKSESSLTLNGGDIILEGKNALENAGTINIIAKNNAATSRIVIGSSAALINSGTILIHAGTLESERSVVIFSDKNGDAIAFNQGTIKAFGGTYADGVFTAGEKIEVDSGDIENGNVVVEAGSMIVIKAKDHPSRNEVQLSPSGHTIVVAKAEKMKDDKIKHNGKDVVIKTGWEFLVQKESETEVLVTIDVGTGLSLKTIQIFHKGDEENAEWEHYNEKFNDITYDAQTGLLSFTTTAFSSYAVAIPEPSAFGLLAGLGALALVASRRRRH